CVADPAERDRTTGKQRAALAGATRIAVPGCNATAVTLALAPGLAAGVIEPTDLVAVLACGTSGAGKVLKPHLLASEIMGSASPYGVGGEHRHVPEIEQNLALAAGGPVAVSFTPTLVPMARGILATTTARPVRGTDAAAVRAAWAAAYAGEAFVRLLPAGQWPTTAAVLGANTAQIQVSLDERAGRVVAISAIDNLGKGTAGAAVQAANIALGLAETTGLAVTGVAP
ncbi:MAG TPA: Asd/ArgC dimerization domain-containing protein, partial [Jiangellaceae bacterium]|nr:Asd/ArgC dimerization domain-containing protein [Jiangellaceae bacterium]